MSVASFYHIRQLRQIRPSLDLNSSIQLANACHIHKIASITFKTLRNSQPSYLHDLLIPYSPPRTLRSSDKHLLTVPSFKSSQARRSFLFAAPTIWNSLPLALRTSTSINSFHAGLKTHLFPP